MMTRQKGGRKNDDPTICGRTNDGRTIVGGTFGGRINYYGGTNDDREERCSHN